MKVGYTVEGSTDRAFLKGLRDRWFPELELVEGRFRGSSGLSLRRELAKIWLELSAKSATALVVLTDANEQHWQNVKRQVLAKLPVEVHSQVVVGVPERNIECWLIADPHQATQTFGGFDFSSVRNEDSKGSFEAALGVSAFDHKEREIADFVRSTPLGEWLRRSRSFKNFYSGLRALANRNDCNIPDEFQSTS